MVHLSPPDLTFDSLDDVLNSIGAAGARVSAIEASEGSAGNISVLYSWKNGSDSRFSERWVMPSPLEVPGLSGAWLAVTGSGRRLREVESSIGANVALVEVLEGGKELAVYGSPDRLYQKPTSELNTHLALHERHASPGGPIHTVLHAQPLHLTYLSHLSGYQSAEALNARLLRWQPELILQLFDGIGVAPFLIPGSSALQEATLKLSDRHRVVIWARHGAIVRVSGSVKKASDLIEYAETGARYECLNLQCGQDAGGICQADLLRLCIEFGIHQTVFAQPV